MNEHGAVATVADDFGSLSKSTAETGQALPRCATPTGELARRVVGSRMVHRKKVFLDFRI